MRFLILGMLLFSVACAHKTTKSDEMPNNSAAVGENASAESSDGVPSFRVTDPEPPKVVDEEFKSIPVEINPSVEKWISYFQGRGRKHMERYLSRSTRYSGLMKKILRENGVPEDLLYVALIESGFSPRATSHAAAVGYWQFIRGTGKRFGLEINAFVDERRDPVLASQAAAEYFKGLYSAFGSWYLSMAAYNVGENRVKREIMRHYTQDFWELARKRRLPKETVNYVPKFIAAKMIAEDPEKFGFEDVDYMPPIEFEHIVTKAPAINIRLMAEKLNIPYDEFKALNPKFKGEVAPAKGGALELRVPLGMTEQAIIAAQESAVDKVEFVADAGDLQIYRVRSGDTLYTIARRFRTTVANLRDINDLPRKKRLKIGMRIQVPDRGLKRLKKVASQSLNVKADLVSNANEGQHVVKQGESLYSIAMKYGISIQALRDANNLKKKSTLKAGARLLIPGYENDNTKTSEKGSSWRKRKQQVHVVKRGETLVKIAGKYRISIGHLKSKNKLNSGSKLLVGSRLLIPEAHAEQSSR